MEKPVSIIHRYKDLRNGYLHRVEFGLILSLLITITGTKVNIRPSEDDSILVPEKQEVVHIEEIIQTKQELQAPPPPRPSVPVEVPNDEVIEEELIDLDAELDINETVSKLPPPPPPAAKEEEKIEEEEIFVVVEQMPELIGGLASIQKHIEYPELARKAGIEGRVVVQFVIDTQGNVVDPVVIRGIGGGCDEEALKAVKKAKFIPGKQRGRPVKVRYSLPVKFYLN